MPSSFSVVALISAYNEADIIEQVVDDLIRQDIQIYFIDDCSTDGTRAIVERFVGRGVLNIESRRSHGRFEWEQILRRKAELAGELEASWFIHHDADEFRESPWPGLSLRDAIQRVDALGFNAIDFASLDFWPTHNRFRPGDDVRDAFLFYSERAPYDRLQVRCWKKTAGPVDLTSTGGHDVAFAGRKVFPMRFVLRHYPIRSQEHGERKVQQERKNRFLEAERALGWHVQYDDALPGTSFIKDPATLTRYDADDVRVALALRHRGVESLEEALEAARGEAGRLARDLDTQAKELRARTRERDALYLELEARTRERDAIYLEREARTRERDALYLDREARTRERDALYLDHETRTRERDALFLEREALAREMEIRATALSEAVERAAKEHAALAGEIEVRSRALRLLEAAVRDRDADLVTHQRAIAQLREVLARRDAEAGRNQDSLNEAAQRIAGYERSLSWQLTAPLRALSRLFKK